MQASRLIASFGRRRGRTLRVTKQGLVDSLLPQLLIAGVVEIRDAGETLAPQSLFPFTPQAVALEIGFGHGEHLAHQATCHPEIAYIGCEPYLNGVGELLKLIEASHRNIRLYQGDAREMMAVLPDACLDHVYILFPDPWPKTRHHKRRLINQDFLKSLARVMKNNATLLLATDHEDYLAWMLEQVLTSPYFEWTAKNKADWQTAPADWVETKYQKKALLESRPATFLHLVKMPS